MTPAVKLAPAVLEQLADAAVEAAAKRDASGLSKRRHARKLLARAIDKALVWGDSPGGMIAELLDGPAAYLAITFLETAVEAAYLRLKAKLAPAA